MSEKSPADWYPDPFGRHERRYWDGLEWTHHVASRGVQQVDPVAPAPPARVDQPRAEWYPDPFGRHQRRFWDGRQWTQHVATGGRQTVDDPTGVLAPRVPVATNRIHQQVLRAAVVQTGPVTLGALFTEPVLVVNQKARFLGADAEYHVHDQHGRFIGLVREVDQRLLRKAMGGAGPNASHRYQIVDDAGRVVISLHSPASLLKSTMRVVGANGTQGQIVQKTMGVVGKVRFNLESGGQQLGVIHAESRAEWDFNIQDESGDEIARITKTWAGWAKERFTTADNYVVQIHRQLEEPLRTLVVAAALAVDTALKEGKPSNRPSSGTRKRRKRRYQ